MGTTRAHHLSGCHRGWPGVRLRRQIRRRLRAPLPALCPQRRHQRDVLQPCAAKPDGHRVHRHEGGAGLSCPFRHSQRSMPCVIVIAVNIRSCRFGASTSAKQHRVSGGMIGLEDLQRVSYLCNLYDTICSAEGQWLDLHFLRADEACLCAYYGAVRLVDAD